MGRAILFLQMSGSLLVMEKTGGHAVLFGF
jgi:hypothetical protein